MAQIKTLPLALGGHVVNKEAATDVQRNECVFFASSARKKCNARVIVCLFDDVRMRTLE
jgi:hypothetical protein